jgi:hypothetical protein
MKAKSHRKAKRINAKTILRLPDLEIAKAAVINSLSCPDARRGYRHAIDEFVDWYCSEPRLSFSKTVVVRYRMHLESRHLAPGTINLRLGAVRRLAYEAADCGLLSADLAAGIRRVKSRARWLKSPSDNACNRHATRRNKWAWLDDFDSSPNSSKYRAWSALVFSRRNCSICFLSTSFMISPFLSREGLDRSRRLPHCP